jgi:hypothetical protein
MMITRRMRLQPGLTTAYIPACRYFLGLGSGPRGSLREDSNGDVELRTMITGPNEEAAWLQAKDRTEKSLAALGNMLLVGLPRLSYLESVENKKRLDAQNGTQKDLGQEDSTSVRVSFEIQTQALNE